MVPTPAAFSLTPRRRSLVWLLVKATLAVALWLPIPVGAGLVWWYGSLVDTTEMPERIDVPVGEIPSAMYSARGFEIGGLERGRREWVTFADLSPWLVRALVANEDARFFSHHGVDLRGIVRAARANVAAGRTEQGGSTLTQQLAKSFVGDARRLERKLTELVVARRLEATYSKASIFEAYVNRIYYGDGAQGVGAAAELYFAVRPSELTMAQAALLTAIVPAPGRIDPRDHPELARERRDRVIERMVDAGYATRAEADAALASPLGVVPEPPERVRAVDVERATWRELAQVGERDWRYGQLAVHTSYDLAAQRQARAAVRDALFALDRRQGLREHLARVVDADAFRAAWAQSFGDRDEVAPAYVTSAASGMAVWRGNEVAVPRDGWSWAVPWRIDAHNHDRRIARADEAFAPGDVVLSRADGIVQFPRTEGALGSVDVADGAIEALVGAFDPDRSQFDRMTQACRQPGSTFKPIVYSAALDMGMTPATLVRDAPIRIDLGPFREWRPRNADGSFDGHMTLWQAFVYSRNLPALSVYFTVGSAAVVQQARRLGVTSPLARVESLALGASCVAPVEMLHVYGTLGRGGHRPTTSAVARVALPSGADLWVGPADRRPDASPASRVERMWLGRDVLSEPVLDPVTAWQTAWLMTEVVRTGTGADLRHWPELTVAGKTGTTNAYDAWFAGFTPRAAAVVWIGSDRNTRPLGRNETGGHLALPAWADAARGDDGATPLLPPPPPELIWVEVDPESGRRAGDGRWALSMPFRYGTAPRDVARSDDEQDLFTIDRIDRQF